MEASLPDPNGSLGSSPYADPREIEHPLRSIASLGETRLAWIQPRLMHPAYELWGGESVAATLRFRDLQHRSALAASADGIWMLSEAARQDAVFTIDAPAGPVAVYQISRKYDGTLMLRGERMFAWVRQSLWGQAYAFLDAAGEAFMRIDARGGRSGKTMVALSAAAVADSDAALMAIAGKYLTLAASDRRMASGDPDYGS